MAAKPRPGHVHHALYTLGSAPTVGKASKPNADTVRVKLDTTNRLNKVRHLMLINSVDYYIVPSEDAHGSQNVAPSDRRLEFVSGFTGSAGQAIIAKDSAYLFTDSRYWLQAEDETDENWTLIRCGSPDAPQDWIEWLKCAPNGSRIGVDACMISHYSVTVLNSKISSKDSKLFYLPQNLVDLVWADKPSKSLAKIFVRHMEAADKDSIRKLERLRGWIRQQRASTVSYSRQEPTPAQMCIATLVTSLSFITHILNITGSDIPQDHLFHAYFIVTLDEAFLFVEPRKIDEEVASYLDSIRVQRLNYTEFWPFLRSREWDEGRVLITPQTSYAAALMLTSLRYTVAPSYIEPSMRLSNEIGMNDRDSLVGGRSQENPSLPNKPTTSAQVMEIVSSAYDHCLTAIAALIGQAHAYLGPNASGPSPDVRELTAEVVEMVCKLHDVAEVLIQHPEVPPGPVDDLESAVDGLFSSASSLIDSARLLFFQPTSTTSEVTRKHDVFRSATSVLKAGADCHSAIKYCLQQTVGVMPLIVDLPIRSNVFNLSKAAQIMQKSNTTTPSRNKNSSSWSDPEPGDVRTNRSDVSSVYSYPSEQNRPVSMQDLDLVEHSYAAALASRLSAMSVYSVASSRTVSTDYGLYYTCRAGSQGFMMHGQSEGDGLSGYL